LTALILKPDGTEIPVVPANFRDFKINELQTICGGFVQVVFLDNDKLLVCNENGMFDGLPENPKASAIYWANGGIPGCPVLGDVLICDKGQIE
jgi:hypothetical protein